MGRAGDKETAKGAAFCERLLPRLEPLGEVTSRKMFGGYGLFQRGKMFGLVTSGAELFLKVGESNADRYLGIDAPRHGKMPYFKPPGAVLRDDGKLLEWSRASVELAHL